MSLNVARLTSILIVVVMAITLLRISDLASAPSPAVSQNATQAVREYYASLNQFMESGDLNDAGLQGAPVASPAIPEFGAFGDDSQVSTYLLALRASQPDLRFSIESIDASDEFAAVVVTRTDAMDSSRSVVTEEFFRLENGTIAGYWPTTPDVPHSHSLLAPETTLRLDRHGQLAIVDMAFEPGRAGFVGIPGPGIMVITAGSLDLRGNGVVNVIDIDSKTMDVPDQTETIRIEPGQAIFIPRTFAVVRGSAEGFSSRLFLVLTKPNKPSLEGPDRDFEPGTERGFWTDLLESGTADTWPGGVIVEPLAVSSEAIEPGTWRFDAGWIVMGAGSTGAIPGAAGQTVWTPLSGDVSILGDVSESRGETIVQNTGDRAALVGFVSVLPVTADR